MMSVLHDICHYLKLEPPAAFVDYDELNPDLASHEQRTSGGHRSMGGQGVGRGGGGFAPQWQQQGPPRNYVHERPSQRGNKVNDFALRYDGFDHVGL